ncbi:sulfate transporter CysZ, partial [Glaesserella parasuis]|nr:sulfate transporter CysZ [Glaesserella parasuis]
MLSFFSSFDSEIKAGFHYFIYGWRLMLQRQLMPFIIFPVIINAVLMISLVWLFFANVGGMLDSLLPSWLEWLSFILIPLAFL